MTYAVTTGIPHRTDRTPTGHADVRLLSLYLRQINRISVVLADVFHLPYGSLTWVLIYFSVVGCQLQHGVYYKSTFAFTSKASQGAMSAFSPFAPSS